MRNFLRLSSLVLALATIAACHRRPPTSAAAQDSKKDAAIGRLESPDAGTRRAAANDLDARGSVPANAVQPLVDAAGKEHDERALAAMLTTLGDSGASDAKTVLDAHADDANPFVRRAAHKALKHWAEKNGQTVRRDVETVAAQPSTSDSPAASASPSTTPAATDGCQQFKDICGKDPFSLEKCQTDLHPLAFAQAQVWADCVNDSKLACQPAHDACVLKAKAAK